MLNNPIADNVYLSVKKQLSEPVSRSESYELTLHDIFSTSNGVDIKFVQFLTGARGVGFEMRVLLGRAGTDGGAGGTAGLEFVFDYVALTQWTCDQLCGRFGP
jgi:hypothetical protein